LLYLLFCDCLRLPPALRTAIRSSSSTLMCPCLAAAPTGFRFRNRFSSRIFRVWFFLAIV